MIRRTLSHDLRPLFLGVAIGLLLLAVLAGGVYGAVRISRLQGQVTEITRVYPVVPGPEGAQGTPGVGVTRVIPVVLPPGANASASLRGGVLTIRIPRGSTGFAGPRGPRGATGPSGDRGERGGRGPKGSQGPSGGNVSDGRLAAAVNAFMRTHSFKCVRLTGTGNTFLCTATGLRRRTP